MTGADLGKAFADAILFLLIVAFIGGGAVVAFLFWGVPWLWHLLKPFLHAWTA